MWEQVEPSSQLILQEWIEMQILIFDLQMENADGPLGFTFLYDTDYDFSDDKKGSFTKIYG